MSVEAWKRIREELGARFKIGKLADGTPCAGSVRDLGGTVYEQVRHFDPIGDGCLGDLPIGQADRLNGVDFRGELFYTAWLAREYRGASWGRWQDYLSDLPRSSPHPAHVRVLVERVKGQWSFDLFLQSEALGGPLNPQKFRRRAFPCSQMPGGAGVVGTPVKKN